MKYLVITSPTPIEHECSICNELFVAGMDELHLRRPGATREDFCRFIELIDIRFRSRILLHDHFELSATYGCGIHLNRRNRSLAQRYAQTHPLSTSCHSWQEVEELGLAPDSILLSPIFDSISKEGYLSTFKLEELQTDLYLRKKRNYNLIALGGINHNNIHICEQLGFDGVALLGYIWQKPNEALSRFRDLQLPMIVSIAGFDPSCGAGITADVKAAEQCGVYCLGVCSAITIQNENHFKAVDWVRPEIIVEQLEILFEKHHPTFFKIGLIECIETLLQVVKTIRSHNPRAYIVWDPILQASSGFMFHSCIAEKLDTTLCNIDVITPNDTELNALLGTTELSSLQEIVHRTGCQILWKGGHKVTQNAEDILISKDSAIEYFTVLRSGSDKHGTGCAYSSVVTALLSKSVSLNSACRYAQFYVSQLLNHNSGKLTLHFMNHQTSVAADLKHIPLQYITDYKEGLSLCDQIELACQGGVKWIQLRMKEANDQDFLATGRVAQAICRRYNALFIINDRVDIAYQLNADGVHLGKDDMDPREARKLLGAGKIIGATCNNWDDILLRSTQQVDYIGLGPYTYTSTKKKLSPVLGLEGYQQLMKQMKEYRITFPVHAIGGIQIEDIPAILECGVSGIALSGLIKNSIHIPTTCKHILQVIRHIINL